MSIRRDPIYIQYSTWKALSLIGRARERSPDEVADEMLGEMIDKKYPDAVRYLLATEKMEKDTIKIIGGKPNAAYTDDKPVSSQSKPKP